jgi:hypothetical protein
MDLSRDYAGQDGGQVRGFFEKSGKSWKNFHFFLDKAPPTV